MSGEGERDEVMRRRLDWGLREVVGGERAPDVVRAVLARAAAGEVVDEAAVPPRTHPWLAAALILLGVGVVVGVYFAKRDATGPDTTRPTVPPQEPQLELEQPKYERVTNRLEIAALPADTPFVAGNNLTDDDFAELGRFTDLSALRLSCSPGPDQTAHRLTDQIVPHLLRFEKLRRLELVFEDQLTGEGFELLAQLPQLQYLEMMGLDLRNDRLEFLPRMPALRSLFVAGLSRTPGPALSPAGIASIAKCAGLRSLELQCGYLGAEALQPLTALVHLERLAVTNSGIDDAGLQLLARFPKLQYLDLFASELLDGSGFAALPPMPTLTTLRMVHCSRLQPGIGKTLRTLCPNLRDLDFAFCPLVDDVTVAEALALRQLHRLKLAGCPKVSEHSLPLLVAARQLREVDLTRADWLTIPQCLQLLASGKRVVCVKQNDPRFNADLQSLVARFDKAPYQIVDSMAALAALPEDTTHISIRGLGDEAALSLARFLKLLGLQFRTDNNRVRLSDDGFAALAKLTTLESVSLSSLDGIHASGLERLRALPALRTLRMESVNRFDDSKDAATALTPLPEFPALEELSLNGTSSFGEQGMVAIARCRHLKSLELSSCSQLQPDWIAHLGGLTGLQRLDLSGAGGVNDRALMGLQQLTHLQDLNLAHGGFTSMGLQGIEGMRELQSLCLDDNAELVPSAMLHLPATLQQLYLGKCSGMDGSAGTTLRNHFPDLTHIGLMQSGWLDDQALLAILQLPKLEVLDLRDCRQLTNRSFDAVVACKSLRRVATGSVQPPGQQPVVWPDANQLAKLRQARPDIEWIR